MLTRRDALIATAALAARPARASVAEEAGAFVDQLGQRTIAALDRVGKDPTARQQAISALLDETVDLTLIARLCLGRHWRTADGGRSAPSMSPCSAPTCWRSCRGG